VPVSDEVTLYLGDCLDILPTLEAGSVDAVVTDPPAGISFMGKDWDHDRGGRDSWIAWMNTIACECLRVVKPGAHALVWALPRTSHWTATAWEDAGWEVRDRVAHLFGSGFPKSLDVSKAIDKMAGAEREGVAIIKKTHFSGSDLKTNNGWARPSHCNPDGTVKRTMNVTTAATDAARQWKGWGTALKPAVEDWLLLRKPLIGSVAENVLEWGTGGINIDACRIPITGQSPTAHRRIYGFTPNPERAVESEARGKMRDRSDPVKKAMPNASDNIGRWPANLIHDGSDEVLAGFPDAARFFYCAKASRADREDGLNGDGNHHPTVKPITLMRYLCRLITPPGGVVLDPFMGSGSTGKGAVLEGFRFIGCEIDQNYFDIARRRIEAAQAARQLPLEVQA
jgi:site-specific DNA-methyltransferase (adenine-specific)